MMHINVTKQLQGAQGRFRLSVELDIAPRSLAAISGVSGSGKSTLLRMIAGLTEPDSGEIVEGGETWFSAAGKINRKTMHRKIGFVFQEYSLFPNMTVKQNLEYAGASGRTVEELLELVELKCLAECYPDRLSGGQKQRVALARALARKPEILLLDEPLSSLDHAMRLKLQDEILRVHEQYPITTILVSHDMSEICRLATRMITLGNGVITGDEAPNEYENLKICSVS